MITVVKINRCPDSRCWYREFVGDYVPFLGDMGTEWKSRELDGHINFVKYNDGELVELTVTTELDKFLRMWYDVSVEVYMNLIWEMKNECNK